MISTSVWNNLVNTLKNAPSLSYIKYVFEGRRDNIEAQSLPCIMIEPVRIDGIEREMNQTKDLYLNVDLFAFSSSNTSEFPKTIVGDNDYKGILDIENDIRAVLQSSYDLGGTVIDVRISTVEMDQLEINKYPVRGLSMPVRILYRQFNGA